MPTIVASDAPKDKHLRVRLDAPTKKAVSKRAAKLGMKDSPYIRALIEADLSGLTVAPAKPIKRRRRTSPNEALKAATIHELNKIGVNLNQAQRGFNEALLIGNVEGLEHDAKAVANMQARLDAAIAKMVTLQ